MKVLINSEPKLLSVLRGMVRYRAQELGFAEEEAEALAAAVNEAAANVMRHTFEQRRDGRLLLEIRSAGDRVEFLLEDSGPKVRAEQVRAQPLGDVRPGGLGMHVIHGVMDSFGYDEDFQGGNRLRMSKRFPRKVSSGDQAEH